MGGSEYYKTARNSDTPLVMETGKGKVHALLPERHYMGKEIYETLCSIPIGHRPGYLHGRRLVKRPFRELDLQGDEGKICAKCFERLVKWGYQMPFENSSNSAARLRGLGIFSARAEGVDRVSISVSDLDQLVSMIRRGR